MTVVLVFVLVVMAFAGWWLVQQRVTSKPWLEVGPDPLGGPGAAALPTGKIALGVFLAVVGALFALFVSAYFMRMAFADWQPMPVPRIVWLNTGMLVLASILLQCAVAAVRQGDEPTLRVSLAAAAVATVAFLAGQVAAWQELLASGFLLAGNPSNSFFYLLTGVHGLHILGGLVALGRPAVLVFDAGSAPDRRRLRPGLELCAMYWHFLLFVWLALVVLFTGWAAEFVDICRQILT